MRVFTTVPQHDLRLVPAAARAAEAEGYDGIISMENQHDPFLALAVAGTATQCARMDIGAAVPDVEGHRLSAERLGAMLDELASVPLEQRRAVPGLDPDRAPTIVAGIVVLTQALHRYELDEVEISDRDILWGTALATARASPST